MREVKILIPDLDDIVPEEALEHAFKATKEFLLAMRTLIDATINKLETLEEISKAKKDLKKIEIE